MIDTCDPDIATWSRDGTAFVVKEPEKVRLENCGIDAMCIPVRYWHVSALTHTRVFCVLVLSCLLMNNC